MSIFQDAGLLIIGTRLKRLSDRFLNEVTRVYQSRNIRFEAAWFPVLFLLDRKGGVSLTEIASQLEVSHSAISQMVNVLQSRKIVAMQSDISDGRLKRIVFTAKGRHLIEQVRPVWMALNKSLEQIFPEGMNGERFLSIITGVEEKLSGNYLSDSTIALLNETAQDFHILEPGKGNQEAVRGWALSEAGYQVADGDKLLSVISNQKIVGFIAFQQESDDLLIRYVYVQINHRRKGIASRMFQYLQEEFQEGITGCFLLEEANLDVIRVFIKSGYSFKVK